MRIIRLIVSDFFGLTRVCGWSVALQWVLTLVLRLPECKRLGNLSPPDRIFGSGPMRVCRNGQSAWVIGPCVMTGVREVWVRDSYLSGNFLTVPDGGIVLDIGAGTGSFTLLALKSANNVRGIAIEAEADRCMQLQEMLRLNHCPQRVKVINAFVGGPSAYGQQIMSHASNQTVPTLSESELLTEIGVSRIDFLKCDIEGSEFELIHPNSPLLAITRQLAMEIHPDSGNADVLIATIKSAGFEILARQQGPTILLFARRLKDSAPSVNDPKAFS